MNEQEPKPDLSGPQSPHFNIDQIDQEQQAGEIPAWEEVEEGRFLPRRIRGSCAGRALG